MNKTVLIVIIVSIALSCNKSDGLNDSEDELHIYKWEQTGLSDEIICSLTANDSNLFAGTYFNGLYVSSDNGINWSSANNGLPADYKSIFSLTRKGDSIIAGTTNGVFYTLNNGASWSATASFSQARAYIKAIAIKDEYIFVGREAGTLSVYRSKDNGDSWTQINNGFYTPTHTLDGVISFGVCETGIYAGTENGQMYFTSNYGNNWTLVEYLPSYERVRTSIKSFAVIDNNVFAGTYGLGLYLSTDSGENWNRIGNGIVDNINSLITVDNKLFAGTYTGVYVSYDNGAVWTSFNLGLPSNNILELAVHENTLFASLRDHGVWKILIKGL